MPFRRKLEIGSWALYDFANTIFSINILSYHFPLWLTVDRGVPEWAYGLVFSLASFLAAVGMPLAGFVSDQSRHRQLPLVVMTLGCVACTALLGATPSLLAVLLFFCLANAFFHSAQVVYNAQIVQLGTFRNLGFISGLGVGVGYLGTICGVLATQPFFAKEGHIATFIPTAVLFLVFALPCLFICTDVKEKRPKEAAATFLTFLLKYKPQRVYQMLRATQPLVFFALFSFAILNVAAIVIMFMAVFAQKAASLTDPEIHFLILTSSAAAIVGSIVFGYLYDRSNPIRIIQGVIVLWLLTFVVNACFRYKVCFFAAAAMAGFSLGATWSVTRVFLIRLVSEKEIAEYYGIFGLLGRIATLTGPLSLALILWLFKGMPHLKYDVLNLFLLIMAALSGYFFSRIKIDETLPKGMRYNNPTGEP